MVYSDRQLINPPTHWHNDSLRTLHARLMAYDGQDHFAHPFRQTFHQNSEQNIGACVLVLLTNEPHPRLLLTKRARHLSSHKSEIAFVGGHKDKSDTSTAHTALREGFEEVGLAMDAVNVIGYLPIQTAKSGTAVRPVVGLIDGEVVHTLKGAECEIERMLWGELDYFVGTPPNEIHLSYDNHRFATPAWTVDGETVWGLTGRIIASLIEIGYGKKIGWYYKLSQPIQSLT